MDISTSDRILEELETAKSQISQKQICALAKRIEQYDRVFVCGTGRTGLMLKAFAMRLMQMGGCPYVIGETITPAIQPGDLLLAASASGTTGIVCDHVRYAVEHGIDTAVITGCTDSPLTAMTPPDLLICAGHKNQESGVQPMGSLFEQMLLIALDSVILELVEKTGDSNAMRTRHANLE